MYKEEKHIAYHGSPCREIVTGKFKKGKNGYLGPGIYFSEDKDYSIRYAKKFGSGSLYKVEIDLYNPLIITSDNPTEVFLTVVYGTDSVYKRRTNKQSNICYLITSSDVKKFLNKGFDGVIWDYAGNKEFVLYDNNGIHIINNEFINENKIMKNNIFNYKPYLKSLGNFMVEHKYTVAPLPKVILDNKEQEGVFVMTGYFDPTSNGIRLFINGRHPKDVLRTFAHELIHWKQKNNGDIEKSGYKSDKITEDKNLIRLESEAYLKGNMAFRSWTETEQKNGKLK